MRFLGRGNTAGDAVTYVPDARVVAAGDLVVLPAPFSFGSYPGDWIETLRKLLALDAVAIVPGHGPVLRDQEYPKTLIRLLESLRAQVGEAVRCGRDARRNAPAGEPRDFRKGAFQGGSPRHPDVPGLLRHAGRRARVRGGEGDVRAGVATGTAANRRREGRLTPRAARRSARPVSRGRPERRRRRAPPPPAAPPPRRRSPDRTRSRQRPDLP